MVTKRLNHYLHLLTCQLEQTLSGGDRYSICFTMEWHFHAGCSTKGESLHKYYALQMYLDVEHGTAKIGFSCSGLSQSVPITLQ